LNKVYPKLLFGFGGCPKMLFQEGYMLGIEYFFYRKMSVLAAGDRILVHGLKEKKQVY
jgi:hypothetical protein